MTHSFKMLFKCESRLLSALAACLLMTLPVSALTTLNEDYESVTVSGSTIVAMDFQSDLYTSDDNGVSFTLRETTTENFEDVEALGATVIAVGDVGFILRSPDSGVTWTSTVTPAIAGSLRASAGRTDGSNPNVWLAVGDDGADGSVLRSMDDGLNWTSVASLNGVSLDDVIWTGTRWLAGGYDSFFFDGIVYSSIDGTNWSASILPSNSTAIRALAADTNGTVLAVGDSGQILRSTDDGLNFVAIATEYAGGGDFNAVIVDSEGTFFVGGDEKRIVEVAGTTATTLAPATATAAPVLDFILIDDAPVAIGGFFGSATRTSPFAVKISVGGSLDYILTIEETLVGRSYFVETTTDLTADDWTLVPGSSVPGNGASISFDVEEDTPRRFWRVVEF